MGNDLHWFKQQCGGCLVVQDKIIPDLQEDIKVLEQYIRLNFVKIEKSIEELKVLVVDWVKNLYSNQRARRDEGGSIFTSCSMVEFSRLSGEIWQDVNNF